MSNIDTRVVEAKFKNDEFGKGVDGTVSALDRLKAGLKLDGAADGLKGVSAAATSFDSSAMEGGASRIGSAFSSMQAVALGAFATIGSKAVSVAGQLASSFTIDPVKAGFSEYEMKMGSIQTILANTSRYGTQLPEVTANLDALNTYADKTIYNFGDMTKNIGLFTNAGIRVGDATSMIKGFSNAAAASGTNAEGASSAAYQLSQALSAGKITLMDWRSLQNVGMGNKNMQSGIIDIANAMGTMKKAGVDAKGVTKDFNGSLEKGWLTADVMSNYLKIMAGDMDDAKMKSLGLNAAQIAQFKTQQKIGMDAATKVRTLSQLMDTLKEAVGSGWTDTWTILFGDFDQATSLFTSLSDSIGGFVGRSAKARNDLLKTWADMGGRQQLLEGLTSAFWALGTPLAVIGEAFRQVFPKTTAKDLLSITIGFRRFMDDLQPGEATIENLRRTFAGVFAILHIGWLILKAIGSMFVNVFDGIATGDKGILKFTATLGDFFVGLDKMLSNGKGIQFFFANITDLIMGVLDPVMHLGSVFGDLMNNTLDLTVAGGKLGGLISAFLSLGMSASGANDPMSTAKNILEGIGSISGKVADAVRKFAGTIAKAFSAINFDDVMKGIQTGGLIGILGVLKQLTGAIKGFNLFGGGKKGGGLFSGINESLEQLSGTLKSMQNNNNASALLKLAGALAILALAVMLLASVDPAALAAASVAMGVLFVELTKGMAMFNKAVGIMGAAKLNLIATALIGISIAVLLLVGAVKILTLMSWDSLGKGLLGLALILGMLVTSVRIMAKNNKGVLKAAAAMLIMAIAINALVVAVEIIGHMDTATLIQGLIGVGAILTELALFQKFAKGGATAPAQAAALVLMAGAIAILSIAVQTLGSMSWENLARGLVGIGAALAILVATLKVIGNDPKLILSAIAIAKVSGALGSVADVFIKIGNQDWGQTLRGMLGMGVSIGLLILAIKAVEKVNFGQLAGLGMVTGAMAQLGDALKKIGEMSWDQIIHGLVGLVGVIAIMVIALKALEKIPATAGLALGLVVGALSLLAPALVMMAAVPIAGIVGALVLLAGVFVILGVAAWALSGSVPVLIGLGIAIALIGVAVALTGAGLLAFAAGFTALGAAAAVGTAGVVAAISAIIGLIPMVLEQIGKGLVAMAMVIANAAPAFIGAMTAVLTALLMSVIKIMPLLAILIIELVNLILDILIRTVPRMIQTGLILLMAFLTGIANSIGSIVDMGARIIENFLGGIARNMGGIITKAVDVIVAFVDGIARNIGRIIQAGVDLILSFIHGLADAARNNGKAMADAGWDLASGIVEGMVSGITAMAGHVWDAVKGMAKGALDAGKKFLGIGSPSKEFALVGMWSAVGMAQGIDKNAYLPVNSVEDMGGSVLDTMGKTISGLGDMISNGMDEFTPTITPVLDLSNVQRDSGLIGDLLQPAPIDLRDTFAKAADASAGYNANQSAQADQTAQTGTTVSFVQNNNSPKALSPTEIYRQTNNQLSRVKGTLTNAR